MKHSMVRWVAASMLAVAIAGCGGSGGGDTGVTPPASGSVKDTIAAAGALASNDTATNPTASFAVPLKAGVTAVTVNGPPQVNFSVFSDGAPKTGLTAANVSFAIAKLIPGTEGNPDQWVNYIYRKETATAGVGPGGLAVPLATAMQATTDGKQTDAALLAAQLVYNADGYYTYTFKTDITKLAQTNNVAFEPTRTHRVAIQLSYTNAAGEAVKVNPYLDFTIDASGKAVPVTDPAKTRKMTDVTSCNSCHEKLAMHGGGRVDTQYCVLCHNPGTTDANSGNNLNLATMVHKIHSGKLLKSKLAAGGEDYTIWGYKDGKTSYGEVGFPQDLRNCSKCHSSANASTPQGDNWKTKPSKEACLTCHANKPGSKWEALHRALAEMTLGAGAQATQMSNQRCVDCHKAGTSISSERVHFNQAETNMAKYKMNIEKAILVDPPSHKGRSVAVTYYLSDPTQANAAYNLVTPDCTGAGATLACSATTKFGNLRFFLAYQNMAGQSPLVTEYSSYNNGGSGAYAYAYKGDNDGKNHYTVNIPLPDDSDTATVTGTARVVSIGQIKEPMLQILSETEVRPEVTPTVLVNTPVQHGAQELAIAGTLLPRRTVVATEKCNACHGSLGTASGANTLANGFHSADRNIVEACVVCHDPNRASSTVMTNGMALNESYQFKRMIHGIHGSSKRATPFTHGNNVVGVFNMDGTSATGGPSLSQQTDSAGVAIAVDNYAAEVAWPGVGINCSVCHVEKSYMRDQGTLGSAVLSSSLRKDGAGNYTNPNVALFASSGACVGATGSVAAKTLACTSIDVSKLAVISPRAATCTACHNGLTASGAKVTDHVAQAGGSAFGSKNQGQIALLPRETCDDCHASGGFKSVDLVHGQK